MSLSALLKGWQGELMGTLAHRLFLDTKVYHSLNNITLPTSNGTTQIDHVIVSRYGLFVVETKNMAGWIFGDAKTPQWTQVLGGKKFRFQNPLHQNYRHTKALEEFLGVRPEQMIPLVMFWGECEFKTAMPNNVLQRGYTGFIKSHTVVHFSETEVGEILVALKSGMLPKGLIQSFKTRRQHLDSLDHRHSSTTTCPKCGKALVQRHARGGSTAFLGCSGFPNCRFTRSC
ncbi:hypothetical protein OTERR_22430 [Oryzomicrobium terrae]|uniref:NERD domain-containing protein n=1 Tax=Oryzomicrobium terrae TaxID=1735038 RepID=A0A5C1EAR6_9RHOO|nr:NERD domain-containing protein [Oryzomicrobium terrae]QEL65719.1 hypothetical protein OTERR_22430 [Oryzomicrobium terrae]